MRRRISMGLVTALALSAQPARAEALSDFGIDVITSSFKCELSRFAKKVKRTDIPAAQMKATIEISTKDEEAEKVATGFSFSFFTGSLGGSGDYKITTTNEETHSFTFNINRNNDKNCRRNNKVKLYAVETLSNSGYIDSDSALNPTTKTITLSATASIEASAKFNVWVLNVGPSGSLSKIRTYRITYFAPPKS